MNPWLLRRIQRVSGRISSMVDALPLDSEEKTRLYHFLAFLLVGIPTMLAFGAYNFWTTHWLLGSLVFALAFSILVTWNLLRNLQSGVWLYRINVLFFLGLLLYMLALGGDGGSKALWLFTLPLMAFFLLGVTEGAAWTAIAWLGAAGLFWASPARIRAYHYGGEFTSRFSAAYLVVAVISGWFEYQRQHYRKGMEAEHERLLAERIALQQALSKVRQLSGMLPICASCKKVRDDRGYWTQLEAYIRDHSEAEFSHSLCPDCGEHLYPGIYRKPADET